MTNLFVSPTSTGSQVRGDSRSGQILIVFAFVFTLIIGTVALMLDGGRIYWEKRMAQSAADAAAMAGGLELVRGNSLDDADVVSWVKNDATLYKFDAREVSVLYPPQTGSHTGDRNFVEVLVERDVPMTFMRAFGVTTTTVRARATAGLQVGGEACIIALNNDSTKSALKVNGSAGLTANCGIMTNSTHSDALSNVGGGSVSASWVGVTGGYSGGGTFTPAPVSSVPAMLDPLAELPIPNIGSAPVGTSSNTAGLTTYQPGIYASEIKITGGDHLFLPGEYILEKGMKVTGGDITGSEVFFYNVNANGKQFIDISSTGDVQLSAPTSGDYKGVLFFNNRDAPSRSPGHKLARGSLNSFFEGSLYFPSQHLDWAGNPAALSRWSLVIADTLNVSGTADLQVVGPPDISEAPPAYTAVLFE